MLISFLLNECKIDVILEVEQQGAIDWLSHTIELLHQTAQPQSSYGLTFNGTNEWVSFMGLLIGASKIAFFISGFFLIL